MKALKIAVIVMSLMIVIGVAVIAVTIAKRSGLGTGRSDKVEPQKIADLGDVSILLPAGSTLIGEDVGGRQLVLKLRLADSGIGYLLVDLETGRARGTLIVETAP